MALAVGNLLGAVNGVMTALSKEKSLKAYLDNINSFGIQVKNNFEVTFSGLTETTFFVTNISLPQVQQNYAELYYNGRKVEIPINFDYTHEFSMTVLNDAQGYIYSAVTNFLMSDAANQMAKSGYTMSIKALTGDKKYKGMLLTLEHVRIESVSGLQFGYADNDISTFDISCRLINWNATPGALGGVAGIAGAVNSLVS